MTDPIHTAYIDMINESTDTKITKSQINTVLDSHGHATIKMTDRMPTGIVKQTPVKNMDGKMVKGIVTGSTGPMTVTNVHMQKHDEIKNKIHASLVNLGMVHYPVADEYVANEGSKSEIRMKLTSAEFPQRSVVNDEYRQHAIVPTFK